MRPNPDLRTPATLALAGLGWFGALHLAGFPWDGLTTQIDQQVAQFLYARRRPELVAFFNGVSLLSSAKYVVLWALLLSIPFWQGGKRREVVALWLVPIAASLTTAALKLLFLRPRPEFAERVLSDFSFPSGHATGAVAFFAFAGWLVARQGWLSPGMALLLGGGAALLIGAARLYLGVHYLSDVLNGYLVGALWALAGAWWLAVTSRRGPQIAA